MNYRNDLHAEENKVPVGQNCDKYQSSYWIEVGCILLHLQHLAHAFFFSEPLTEVVYQKHLVCIEDISKTLLVKS